MLTLIPYQETKIIQYDTSSHMLTYATLRNEYYTAKTFWFYAILHHSVRH